jgi:hypothetical protein
MRSCRVSVRRWAFTTRCWRVECLVKDQRTPIDDTLLIIDRRHSGARRQARHRPAAGDAGQPQNRAGARSQAGRAFDQGPAGREVHWTRTEGQCTITLQISRRMLFPLVPNDTVWSSTTPGQATVHG